MCPAARSAIASLLSPLPDPVRWCSPASCCRPQWLKKYAALVRFVSADEVRREFFTPDTVPEDFGGQGFPPKGKGK